jgi:hypothetical protein
MRHGFIVSCAQKWRGSVLSDVRRVGCRLAVHGPAVTEAWSVLEGRRDDDIVGCRAGTLDVRGLEFQDFSACLGIKNCIAFTNTDHFWFAISQLGWDAAKRYETRKAVAINNDLIGLRYVLRDWVHRESRTKLGQNMSKRLDF